MRIVQIAPFVSSGSGQAGVVWNLERAFTELGHDVESFTLASARRGRPLPQPSRPLAARVARAWRPIWFSTVGTARARRFLADRPGSFSICHDGVMTGDVYVSHGILRETAAVRGRLAWRLARNPALLFIHLRDLVRYRGRWHRVAVALSAQDAAALRRAYGRVTPPLVVIPNGVDLERFHPPSADERTAARAAFHLDDDARVALFVGHDVVRKGLLHAVRALAHAPTVLLLVVGGDLEGIEQARAEARRLGVEDRVLFAGVQHDLPLFFAASDMFVFPTSYEANALVVLEALASGLPVVTTPVGYAPEIIREGENGLLVSTDPAEIGDRLEQLAWSEDLAGWRARARRSVEDHSWRAIAQRYLVLAEGWR
jgi:UDP-glucose:(heptosyl)LPS alpha-1,3-glucosyltransferase